MEVQLVLRADRPDAGIVNKGLQQGPCLLGPCQWAGKIGHSRQAVKSEIGKERALLRCAISGRAGGNELRLWQRNIVYAAEQDRKLRTFLGEI